MDRTQTGPAWGETFSSGIGLIACPRVAAAKVHRVPACPLFHLSRAVVPPRGRRPSVLPCCCVESLSLPPNGRTQTRESHHHVSSS